MTSLNSQQEKSLIAFMTALSQQDEAIPSGLQAQLQAIGQNIENRAVELPAIAASLPGLNRAYQQAMANPPTEGEPGATLVSRGGEDSSDKLRERAVEVFTAPDPVQAAQSNFIRSSGQVASNPFKRFFGRG